MVGEGEGAQVEALLVRRFRRESRPAGTTPASTGGPRANKPKEYGQATELLRDLHVIAQREDDITAFTARVRELRTRYAKRPSLMDRLDKAGLPWPG